MTRHFLAICLMFLMLSASAAYQVQIDTDKENAIYTKGEKIVFSVAAFEDKKAIAGKRLSYTIIADGAKDSEGTATSAETPCVVSITAPEIPGWVLLTVNLLDDKGRSIASAQSGAMVDPDKIQAGAQNPSDFDAFWAKEKETLASLPMSPQIKPVEVPEKLKDKVLAFDVRLDCGNSNYAFGYLAKPAKAEKGSLPAIVHFCGASVIGVSSPSIYYAENSLTFLMAPHSVENGQTSKYYGEFAKEHLGGYNRRNADDRDKYYMKGMYIRVLRVLQFVKSQPEWNGKILIAHGESQGGAQAIVAAALDPDVSLCITMVPAMSDHLGYKLGRRNGWPGLIKVKDGKEIDEFNEKAATVAPYFDNVNFARRIKAPVWIATGFIDTTCPPSSVYAVYNSLPESTEKHLHTAPKLGHGAGYPGAVVPLKQFLGKE